MSPRFPTYAEHVDEQERFRAAAQSTSRQGGVVRARLSQARHHKRSRAVPIRIGSEHSYFLDLAYAGADIPSPPPPIVGEPPPWAAEESGPPVPLASPATGDERPDALAVIKAEDGETSSPEPPGPPVVLEPLIRPLPPPPDWREIEAERERQRAAETQERLEPPRDPYPARPNAGEARTVARRHEGGHRRALLARDRRLRRGRLRGRPLTPSRRCRFGQNLASGRCAPSRCRTTLRRRVVDASTS